MVYNIDTLIIAFDFSDYRGKFFQDLDHFESMKREAMKKDDDVHNEKVYVNFLGMRFEILGNGKMGYAYILHNDLIEIDIAKFRSRNDDMYPVMIRFKAEMLWSQGLNGYHWLMDKIIRYYGSPIAEKLSRVDLACHIEGLDMQVSDIDCFVGKHRKDTIHRKDRRVQTIYIGSRKTQTIMLRIYNKSSMIIEERKGLWFIDVWNSHGMNPTNVWNVEYELHRKALKELKIDTFNDLSGNLLQLWEYLTKQWVRHVDLKTDERRSRCKTTKVWTLIQGAYKNFDLNGRVQREVIQIRKNDALLPAIAGYITSYSANLAIHDISEVLELLYSQIPVYLADKHDIDFREAVNKKYSEQVIQMFTEYELKGDIDEDKGSIQGI